MNDDDLIGYEEAARLVGVPVETVRQWKSRHRLPVAATAERGRLLFRVEDVIRADKQSRPQGRKRRSDGGVHPERQGRAS